MNATEIIDVQEFPVVAFPAGWLSPWGLMLPADISENQLQDLGFALLFLDEANQWNIGDWYNIYRDRYGPKAVARYLNDIRVRYPYLRVSKLKLKTIRNYASICKIFPLHSRKWEHLGFWHYYKVAGYCEEEREYLLSEANIHKMTPQAFEKFLQEYDKNRKKQETDEEREDRQEREQDMAARNGRLEEQNQFLNDTVEALNEQVEELTARVNHAETRVDSWRQIAEGRLCWRCRASLEGE